MKNILIFNDFSPEAEHATFRTRLTFSRENKIPTCTFGTPLTSLKTLVARELAVAHAGDEEETEVTADN